MKKVFSIFALALCVGAMMSCNKEASVVEDPEITFGMSPKSAFFDANSVQTKATAVTSLTSFKAGVTQGAANSETNAAPCWNNIVFTSDGEITPTYKASPKKYWPLTDPHYNVYAVSASVSDPSNHAAVASEAPDMVFAATGSTITMAADYNKDVITAFKATDDITWKTKNLLAFEHIFARVSTVKVTAGDACAISNITISIVDPKTGGTYNLRTGQGTGSADTGWTSKTTSASGNKVIYSNNGTIATGTNHTGADNDYYILPGSYSLIASWTASVDDYSQTYTNKTSVSPITIQRGKINSIEATLTGDPTELTFSVSISEWGSNVISGVGFNH